MQTGQLAPCCATLIRGSCCVKQHCLVVDAIFKFVLDKRQRGVALVCNFVFLCR